MEQSHMDDEYAAAGVTDPKVCITTSRDPSSKLKEFTKVRERIHLAVDRPTDRLRTTNGARVCVQELRLVFRQELLLLHQQDRLLVHQQELLLMQEQELLLARQQEL